MTINEEQKALDLLQTLAEGMKMILEREEAKSSSFPKAKFVHERLEALRKAIRESPIV